MVSVSQRMASHAVVAVHAEEPVVDLITGRSAVTTTRPADSAVDVEVAADAEVVVDVVAVEDVAVTQTVRHAVQDQITTVTRRRLLLFQPPLTQPMLTMLPAQIEHQLLHRERSADVRRVVTETMRLLRSRMLRPSRCVSVEKASLSMIGIAGSS